MKAGELRAKALLSALISELTGLRKAFTTRSKSVQSYKVTQMVIDIKRGKQMHADCQQAKLEGEIEELQSLLAEKEQEIMRMNARLLQ